MNNKIKNTATVLAVALVGFAAFVVRAERPPRRATVEGAKLHKFSKTVEKKRPQLDEETKKLISAYRCDPSEANRAALEKKVRENYDKVIARKQAKLEELKKTARHESKIKEMEAIVREVIADKENRVARSMQRFTDPRLRPGAREAKDGFHPLIGGGKGVSIAHTEVTNADYAKFKTDWPLADDKPVVGVSYRDALVYCGWLTARGDGAIYRLPTEEEWEIAAGHMPKDADFNAKGGDGVLSPVTAHGKTQAACGAIDMWGNCWEWTSTARGAGKRAVKGGAWSTPRTDCRTECREFARKEFVGHPDVGFRIVKEVK